MNTNTKIKFSAAFSCLICMIVLFQSCEKKSDADVLSQSEFHKNAQLTNIFENEILPLASSFKTETKLLEQEVKAYQNNASDSNLNAAQSQWKTVQLIWKQLELYDLGVVAESFIAFEINRWPTDTVRIETNIEGEEELNENFIASIGSSSKGISALEYMLFSDVVASSDETYALRRKQYMVALAKNLSIKSEALLALWQSNKVVFTGALENGITGSQNQVINAMVTLVEEIIISKLGRPLGDANGGTIALDELEAYRSEFSKEIIQQHLIALKRCYTGDFKQTPFRVGFDDFLVLIGSEDFSIKINNQFKACQNALDHIEGSLEDALETNPEAVINVKNAFRDLLVLLKVDMANVLGSTITFNDNDGD